MSLSSGFFSSVNHDRLYNASQFAALFNSLITDGVFDNHGELFAVTAVSGLNLEVASGYAWFKSTWSYNPSPLAVSLNAASTAGNRYDAVVLEVNHTERANSIKVVEGSVSAQTPSYPSLINNDNVRQYPLAYVYVAKNATVINASDITNMVGTPDTPLVTGILQTVDISVLFSQWEGQFNDWENAQQTAFNTWLASVQGLLQPDVGTRLTAEIVEIEEDLATVGGNISGTLSANSWVSGVQTATVTGVTANMSAFLTMPSNATAGEKAAFKAAAFEVTNVASNSITIKCNGAVPKIAVPINVKIIRS